MTPRTLTRVLATGLLVAAPLLVPATAVAYGPPFPDPTPGVAVYDEADIWRAETEQRAETIIDGIEARTGAEVAVYSQLVPGFTSDADAEQHAIALMDQWGVGRAGFDDGLVILFDIYEGDECHGRVQLYAGPGYRATFLSNSDRQAIFDNDMLPLLRGCNLDGALLVALDRVDANATPEHAALLSAGRTANAVLGLLVSTLVFVGLSGWAIFHWLRYGRDPYYLDDPSIHIPAPPPGLTPAAGALMRDGKANRRALTAAMMDIAARNRVQFEPEKSGLFGLGGTKLTIQVDPPDPREPVAAAQLERIRRRQQDPATTYLYSRLKSIGGSGGEITPDELLKLGASVGTFNSRLEDHVVKQQWYRERPSKSRDRWGIRGTIAIIVGVMVMIGASVIPSDGLLVVGVAAIFGGLVQIVVSGAMPAVTLPGAMIRAMLAAYRRTLEKTMAQARSMDQVVAEAALPIITEPDDAVAWGVALGLQEEVEEVLRRSTEDIEDQRVAASSVWLPRWYGANALSSTSGNGGGGLAPGLMSNSAIPNFGGMMAVLTTIGNSPSSSGSGGGGFSGGSSGGGGGGAGGGF